MLRKFLAVVFFVAFGLLAFLSGVVCTKLGSLKGFAIAAIMLVIAIVLNMAGIKLWLLKPKSQSVEWNLIKNHISLEGLNVIIDTYPEIKEEAGELAKTKRFVARLSESMHHFPFP